MLGLRRSSRKFRHENSAAGMVFAVKMVEMGSVLQIEMMHTEWFPTGMVPGSPKEWQIMFPSFRGITTYHHFLHHTMSVGSTPMIVGDIPFKPTRTHRFHIRNSAKKQ